MEEKCSGENKWIADVVRLFSFLFYVTVSYVNSQVWNNMSVCESVDTLIVVVLFSFALSVLCLLLHLQLLSYK